VARDFISSRLHVPVSSPGTPGGQSGVMMEAAGGTGVPADVALHGFTPLSRPSPRGSLPSPHTAHSY